MKRKKLSAFIIVVLLLMLTTACISKTAETLQLGSDTVSTLYSTAGEKKITGSSKSSSTKDGIAVSQQKIVYGSGDVTIDDINGYILKLVQDDGFVVTKDADVADGAQTYQIGKESATSGKILLVDFSFTAGANATITYTLTDGTLTAD